VSDWNTAELRPGLEAKSYSNFSGERLLGSFEIMLRGKEFDWKTAELALHRAR
jgi:hypothetical protein